MSSLYSLIFHEMLFSRLNFFSELKNCRHWWLVFRLHLKWNATWHLILTWLKHEDYMKHEMLIHVYFTLCLVVKRKVWSRLLTLRVAVWTEVFICLTTSKSVKMTFIVWISWIMDITWKIRLCFLSKVSINKTGSFQWSITRAVVKTMLYLFGTHAYWTEILYRKFSVRIRVPLHPKLVPYLLLTHIIDFIFFISFFFLLLYLLMLSI